MEQQKSTTSGKKSVRGFATRWGLILSLIGASAGTGNVWRFPRMAALNGGGSFVLAWLVSLVIVSIPVIIAEMVLGRATRHGCPGAFRDFIGKKYTWMGAFLSLTCIGITAYYTAIMAWVLQYAIVAATKGFGNVNTELMYENVVSGNWMTVALFIVSLSITAFIVSKGIGSGIEKVNNIMVPTLFILLIIVAVRCVTLPGAAQGLEFLFAVKKEYLFNPQTWLSALSQSAWSVGPGWGLVLTYAVYTKAKSDVALNEFIQGFGNNSVALLAGFAVLPAIFASVPTVAAAEEICASGNYGLTFVYLAKIFPGMPGGYIIGIMFFVALYFAALSSNLVMLLTGITPLMDAGWSRKKATITMFTVCLIWGLPSAWSLKFLGNQDWVFGMTLLVGTLFTCFAIFKYGTDKVRTKLINIPENEMYIGKWWTVCMNVVVPITITIMFGWWVVQSISWYPDTWWNPFLEFSLGTVILQASIHIIVLVLFNKKMSDSIKHKYFDGNTYPPIPEEHA